MRPKPFVSKEISTFLKAIEKHLKEPCRIEMIGGAVAQLCFKSQRGTLDIDITGGIDKIEKACQEARKETGLDIPVQSASIWDGPHEYESRLKRLTNPKLRNLQVMVPEKHDWALIKLVRFNEKDIEDITEVSYAVGFNENILLERFLNEMTTVLGRPSELVLSFVLLIEKVFGEVEADRIERRVRSDNRWSRRLKEA